MAAELVGSLNEVDRSPALVRAAMAHLNLVMIHPFRDGNGRMARALQTLVLAREGILVPEFASIEEYLGRNTPAYCRILAEVGGGRWQPDRDTRPWVRFCLTAHYRQAATILQRVNDAERTWGRLDEFAQVRRLPERAKIALYYAVIGLKVRNSLYRTDAEISEQLATKDLIGLVELGLLVPEGERRGRYYTAGVELKKIRAEVHAGRKPVEDPFDP